MLTPEHKEHEWLAEEVITVANKDVDLLPSNF
jgi:hypothetical protein